MVANDDNLIRDSAVDYADRVPLVGGYVLLLVDEIKSDLRRSRSNVVADILVTQTTSVPPGRKRGRGWAVSVQCSKNGQGLLIGEWERWDRRDLAFSRLAWNSGFGWVANGCWVTGSNACVVLVL